MTENRKPRILAVWGASHFDGLLQDAFLENDQYDFEIVSGDRSRTPSPHAADGRRLRSLRRRLRAGEFDLVISGPVQNTRWLPPGRGLATRAAHALRHLTYKRSMLDTYWTPWLVDRPGGGKVPLAVIDFYDTSFVLPQDLPLLQAATLYFKLNLYFWPRRSLMPLETFLGMRRVTGHTPKLRPLTNGIPGRMIPEKVRPMRERDIDVCFTGTIVPNRSAGDVDPFPEYTFNPIRQEVYERCEKLKERGYNVYCVNRMVPKAEYFELLQRSKLMVCTESFGCETFRHYDVAAAGAVPLVNWPYAQNYMPFQPDVHAIYFSMIGDDFERTVDRALADPARLEKIAAATRAFTLEHKERLHVGDWIVEETLRRHAANAASAQG
jgi:hypothetical protein